MQDIYIPTLLFWENGNSWYGSCGQARFFVRPVREKGEEGQEAPPPRLEAELWRGLLTRELSEILERAAFPLSAAQIAVEEAAVMFALGLPLLRLLPRSRAFVGALSHVR